MNRRPILYIGLAILVIAGAGFAYFNGSGHDPGDPGAQITVFTEDLQDNALSGVEIQVLDEQGNNIDSRTTNENGSEISLSDEGLEDDGCDETCDGDVVPDDGLNDDWSLVSMWC
ncbi:MAG: hypothetical protein ACC652_13870, partial [Acidimicrobiales bacterium]